MAKYIKQELPDLKKVGENKAYYRMETSRRVSMAEFVESLSMPGSGITEASAVQVLNQAASTLARLLADGCAVTIEGIGTFKATVGVRNGKEQDAFSADEPQRNAQSIVVNGVHYKADRELIKEVHHQCTLERGKQSCIKRSPYTLEERIQRALAYIEEHDYLTVSDYANLNGLSVSTASVELRKLRSDDSSGIRAIGKRSGLMYVKEKP
jgi:predicted histone-like DNA-binding protein